MKPEIPTFPWKPFVVTALLFTLTVGALSGAIDLWNLRVGLHPVAIDHHRAHGLAQIFGFLALFTMGVSLQLAPRFFGVAPPSARMRALLIFTATAGVGLLVVGRLGRLIPWSGPASWLGAILEVVAMSTWLGMVVRFWRDSRHPHDSLQRFMLAGVSWWWLASLTLLGWALGAAVPLDSVWTMALLGGTGSWIWGIFFRAGICTLHLRRPSEKAQSQLWLVWQVAAAVMALAPWLESSSYRALASVAMAAAVGFAWKCIRPFSGEGLDDGPSLAPRAVQAGLVSLAIFGVLNLINGAVALGAWGPPLLVDATRHSLTFGLTLMVLGFAGRMVPGFSGNVLRWSRGYDAGVFALTGGLALRLCELLPIPRLGLALAGASGGLAFLGLALIASSLLGSMRWPALSVFRNWKTAHFKTEMSTTE